jgi:transposase
LDVHKKAIVACRMWTKQNGHVVRETCSFGTTTAELLRLQDWLLAWECSHAALESTGGYWKPVYNIPEGQVEILLVNARHVKNVPGRKTAVGDAEWLADLLRHRLLCASFVPPCGQRELRDLTRQRSNLVRERAAVVNRLQKVLEDANIKLASVATDVLAVSERAMLEAIVGGETDPTVLAKLACGRLRDKHEELEQALTGRVRDHHRFLLETHLRRIDFLDEQIEQFNQRIVSHIEQLSPAPAQVTSPDPATVPATASEKPALSWNNAIELLDTIPGIDRQLAEVLIAGIGIDMGRSPSEHHLSSRAGVAPGDNESVGKRRSGKTTPGNPPLRKALVQAAHAARRKNDCYLGAQYHRLAARRGKKRATLAVVHSILVIAYQVLSRQEPYQGLGGNYFDERKRESVANRLVRRLEKPGYRVALEMQPNSTGSAAAT